MRTTGIFLEDQTAVPDPKSSSPIFIPLGDGFSLTLFVGWVYGGIDLSTLPWADMDASPR